MHNAASPVIAAVRWSSGELAAPHKTLDPITLDADATGTVGLADGKILEIARGHFDAPTNNNATSCPRHDQFNLPNQAPPATAAATIRPKVASATACATNTSERLAFHRARAIRRQPR